MKEPKETICWRCDNATGGCSWSAAFVMVKGAKTIHNKNGEKVIKCPLFVHTPRKKRKNDK